MAIDLGSMSETSNSRDGSGRIGDTHRIAGYLTELSQRLIKQKPEKINDNQYRLASLLDDFGRLLLPHIVNQRVASHENLITEIRQTFFRVISPWKAPLELKNFNDAYNAQTLAPWHVSSLLVDPDEQWRTEISGKGPMVITGMRGCGKTMLLRSMQFHAKAIPLNTSEEQNIPKVIARLEKDGYVGIYVSSTKLLDKPGKVEVSYPFARLFASYGIQTLRAIRHLYDLDKSIVDPSYYLRILEVFKSHLNSTQILDKVNSDFSLENALIDIQNSLTKGESEYDINVSPSNAFNALAKAIKSSTSIWNSSYVLFLFDDVTTRYLQNDDIVKLLSSLIFQSENCAFKITCEAQTIEILLNSPGNIEKAREGRDYRNFDLGEEVNKKLRGAGSGKAGINFLQKILSKRATYHSRHPNRSPKEILGDTPLISIARSICELGKDSSAKNKIYWGITALAGVCVGDIGDVISIYDGILNSAEQGNYPVSPEKQSEVYRNTSSIRLYVLTRRESYLNDFATSFAEAAHELLLQSYQNTPNRLRQYYSIYISITSDDIKEQESQFAKLIELIDAGVFVFTGGASSPRMLGKDTNPLKQFVIQYRKLYGITNLIGLQQADRFELSGERLSRWLNNPKDGKKILMEGLGKGKSKRKEKIHKIADTDIKLPKTKIRITQTKLFEETYDHRLSEVDQDLEELVKQKLPTTILMNSDSIEKENVDTIIIGLGFEERTLESAKRILISKPKRAILIEYDVNGKSKEIKSIVKQSVEDIRVVNYKDDLAFLKEYHGKILCDVSGLSKRLIFDIVKSVLASQSELIVAHTKAKIYYPLDKDINDVLEKDKGEWDFEFLNAISDDLIKGEGPPYEIYQLIENSNVDETKRRILFGFATSKYEKLFKVLDEREYDSIEIISPKLDKPRNQLAKIAAQLIKQRFNFANVSEYNQYDLSGMLEHMIRAYQIYYVKNNFNFEIALTGSKRHAVACAVIASEYKIANCWYMAPGKWDTERFSKGVGETEYFYISTDSNSK
nr:hypothetical protein [uncultured Allomuricauda sp.]